MPDFSPGPWEDTHHVIPVTDFHFMWGFTIQEAESGLPIAEIYDKPYHSDEETAANIRLITAAPDMYNFIRTLYELLTNPEDDEEGLSFRFIPEAAKQILDRIDGKED